MKRNSIRTKMIVFMLLPIVILMAAAIVVSYSHTTSSLRTRAVEENTNLLYQGYRNIDSLLQEVNRVSLSVYSDSEFYRQLEAGVDDISAQISIYSSLNYIYKAVPEIFQVYLYGIKGNHATIIVQDTPKRWQDSDPYPVSALPEEKPLYVETSHNSHHYGLLAPFQPPVNEEVFTLHRRIEKVPSTEAIGYLSIDIRLSALQEIADQLYDRNNENLYIVDSSGNLVYADKTESIGKPLDQPWFHMISDQANPDYGSFEQDGSVFVYQRMQSSGADWMLIKQIPESYLLREANEAAKINVVLFGVALLLIITATIVISIRITSPIKRLTRYMSQIRTGNLQVDIVPAGNDEVGVLTERFREMMDTINNLILREYKLDLASKNNQLRALQAQINPHFLNNTLQIIGTLALELKVPQIYALISSLAKMMRYSMHNDDRSVTLLDELEHVKAYIQLQKERFENRFTFQYEIEDSLLDVEMPKMILQPITENYFKHGIDKHRSDGWIRVTADRQDDGRIRIAVENNGAGIPEDKLLRLQNSLSLSGAGQVKPGDDRDEEQSTSIGLANVLTRLRLVYGEDAELIVTNIKSGGVRIEIIFQDTNDSKELGE